MEFKQKNKRFNIGKNEAADYLLYFIENLDILPKNISIGIESFVLGMTSNFKSNKDKAKEFIEEINLRLRYLNVYTDDFRAMIYTKLWDVYAFENRKNS